MIKADRLSFRHAMARRTAMAKLLCNEPPTLESISFSRSDTVAEFLARLDGAAEPPGNLALLHSGVELARDQTMGECGVADGAVLHVIARRRSLRLDRGVAASGGGSGPPTSRSERGLWRDRGASGTTARHVPSLEDVVAPTTLRSRLTPQPSASFGTTAGEVSEAEGDSSDDGLYDYIDTEFLGAPNWFPSSALAAKRLNTGGGPPAPLPPSHASDMTGTGARGHTENASSNTLDDSAPPDRLQLQWATGFNPSAGALVLGTGEVVYAAGRICVVIMYIYICICKYLCIHTCIYIDQDLLWVNPIYIHTHTHTHIYIYIYVYRVSLIYIYIYIHEYIYITRVSLFLRRCACKRSKRASQTASKLKREPPLKMIPRVKREPLFSVRFSF